MPQPGISIITPVYNSEKYITACIESVIAQQCPVAEHIIVDGNSTDRTVDIIKRYANTYSHIRWLSEKDRSPAEAMNKGLRLANAEILGFLNADDYYEPGVLNRVVSLFLDLPNPSLAVGNCLIWKETGTASIWKSEKLRQTDLLLWPILNPHPVNPVSYFYHKSIHDIIGPFDNNEEFLTDLDFLFKAVKAAHIYYYDETWGNYRFFKGTKTFDDHERGLAKERAHNFREQFINSLPLFQRLNIKCQRAILPKIHPRAPYYANRLDYYVRRPKKIFEKIAEKLKKQ